MIMEYFLNFYNKYNSEILLMSVMVLSLIPAIFFIKKVIFSIIRRYLNRYEECEKILQKYSIYTYLLHSLLSLYLTFWSNVLDSYYSPYWIKIIKNNMIGIYTGVSFTMLILAVIDGSFEMYQRKITIPAVRRAPLSLCIQVIKIIIIAIAAIIVISHILNISPKAFFTSLGAAAALLTFLFKDTVVGLIASFQIVFYDIIRIGDYVKITQLNIEGTVEKITIAIIKIRNADQTISTIPTGSLLTQNVVNSRGIKEVSAQKIQRAIYIDMNSIIFTTSLLQELKKSPHLVQKAIDNIDIKGQDKITNIKIFRLYVTEYLKNNSTIYTQGFTFLVRQLAPTINGLPLELYVFTKEMNLDIYENLQSDIFDHVLAVLPEFQLKIFQK